jgi:Laminin G domain
MTPQTRELPARKVLTPAEVLPYLSVRFLRASSCSFRRWALLVVLLLAASAAAGAQPAFAAWATVAVWEMDEGTTASTMHDSSGANRDGSIGSVVETGVSSGGDLVYQWPPGDLGVENPERLVTVPGRGFNPQRNGFAVTIRFKTSDPNHNMIQKGQATSPGLWKIELNNGRAFCFFKGSSGRGAIGSSLSLADNEWHTVRCVRRSGRVSIAVDGGGRRTIERKTGKIANAAPVAIGGKFACNPPNGVSCQYYVGQIGRAVVKRRR